MRRRLKRALPHLILLLAVGLAFGPILKNGFVNWDDDVFLLRGTEWRGLGLSNLRWMLTSFSVGAYQPLPWIVLALIYLIQGLNPLGFHLASLLCHAANALLLFVVLRRLIDERGAFLAALLWAVHPVQVQLVAWATPLSDVLATFFFLLSVLLYLRARPGRGSLAPSILAFAASALCRWKGFALPLALILLDFTPLERLSVKDWRKRAVWSEKLPYLLITLALLAVNARAKALSGGGYQAGFRPSEAAGGVLVLASKLLAPFGLIPLYSLQGSANPMGWAGWLCVAAFVVLTAGLVFLARRAPAALAAWLFFAISVAPPLVATPPGPVFVSLAYEYLATLGFAAAAAAVLSRVRPAQVAALVAAPLLIVLCRAQDARWHDSIALWTHTLRVDPDAYVARNNLGAALMEQGEAAGAAALFREELLRRPDDEVARRNLEGALARLRPRKPR